MLRRSIWAFVANVRWDCLRCFPALAILELFVRSLDDDKVIGETEGYMSDERELVKRYYYFTVFYDS